MTVVAEGVETDEILHLLAGLGCDAVQGYVVAKPMEGRAAAAWLAEWDAGRLMRRQPH